MQQSSAAPRFSSSHLIPSCQWLAAPAASWASQPTVNLSRGKIFRFTLGCFDLKVSAWRPVMKKKLKKSSGISMKAARSTHHKNIPMFCSFLK